MTFGDRPDVVSLRIQRRARGKRTWEFVDRGRGKGVRWYGLDRGSLSLAFEDARTLNKRNGDRYVYRVVKYLETDAGITIEPANPQIDRLGFGPTGLEQPGEIVRAPGF